MGKPVTVDSDDLEVILMNTGVAKQVEQLIYQHKNDPFVCKDDAKIGDAHKRLNGELLKAKRIPVYLDYEEPLSAEAFAVLRHVIDQRFMYVTGTDIKTNHHIAELRRKGYLSLGSIYESVFWADTQTVTRSDKGIFMIAASERGTKLASTMTEKAQNSIQ